MNIKNWIKVGLVVLEIAIITVEYYITGTQSTVTYIASCVFFGTFIWIMSGK